MQGLDALDLDPVGPRARDSCAHGAEHPGKINHLGFARCILDERGAAGERGSHHEIFGAGDGDHVGDNARTLQAGGTRHHIAVFD